MQEGLTVFLGLLCFSAFTANAVLLAVLLVRRNGQGLARCPRCNRQIICPHCEEEDEPPDFS